MNSSSRISIEESLSLEGPPDAIVGIGGRNYQYHAGNGFYALQAHPEVLASACEATLRYGISTATSRAAFTAPPIFGVQKKVSEIFRTEHTFYCSSGYISNRILLGNLHGTFDRIFIDEAAHCSLIEAAKSIRSLGGAPVVFAHRNTADLKNRMDATLQLHQRPLILTDGVFSSTGTIAPLDEYDFLLREYEGAAVLVNDAQGFGILGRDGRGTLEHFNFSPNKANRTVQDISGEAPMEEGKSFFETPPRSVDFLAEHSIPEDTPVQYYFSATLSKALGGSGGIISGSESFIQRIIDHSRAFYGMSAPPSPIAAASEKALELVFDRVMLRESLLRNTTVLKAKLRKLGLGVEKNPVPIIAFQPGSAHNMRRIQRTLSQRGILIAYLPRSPGSGPDGTLRIAVFATHTPEMLEYLIDTLRKVL